MTGTNTATDNDDDNHKTEDVMYDGECMCDDECMCDIINICNVDVDVQRPDDEAYCGPCRGSRARANTCTPFSTAGANVLDTIASSSMPRVGRSRWGPAGPPVTNCSVAMASLVAYPSAGTGSPTSAQSGKDTLRRHSAVQVGYFPSLTDAFDNHKWIHPRGWPDVGQDESPSPAMHPGSKLVRDQPQVQGCEWQCSASIDPLVVLPGHADRATQFYSDSQHGAPVAAEKKVGRPEKVRQDDAPSA